jgi:hypothetical protein
LECETIFFLQYYLTKFLPQECSNKKSVSVVDECLKLVFLFHTLAQSKKYRQDATTLLLEALLMVFSLSSDTVSQVILIFFISNNVTESAVQLCFVDVQYFISGAC